MSERKTINNKKRVTRNGMRPATLGIIALGSLVTVLLLGVLIYGLTTDSGTAGGAQVTPEVKGAPRLRANLDVIDMGDVKLGKTVQAEFVLTNTGDQTLRFTDRPYIEVVEGC